jgi:type I restriction enzyme S subunit
MDKKTNDKEQQLLSINSLLNQSKILADVCEFVIDCEHKTAPTQNTGYPSIRTPNIGKGKLILENVNRVSEEIYKAWSKRAIPQADDLILAREAPVGNVAIIPKNLKVCLGQRTVLIRPDKEKVSPNYLCYLLLGDEIQSKFISISNGATVHHLNLKDIRNLELPIIPPLPTQQKIASILSAYDDLIENNTRRIKILEEMAQTLYNEWFVNFRFPGFEQVQMVESELGLIPEGWEVRKLGDIAQEIRRSIKPDLVEPETPYFGLEHLPRKSIALSEWGKASDIQSTKLVFKKGEILFGKIRPYFHKVGVAPIDGICSSDIIVIIPKNYKYFSIILGCVSSEDFVNHATQTSQGTKMPRANWEVLTKYPIVIPPPPLLLQFNEFISNIVQKIQNLVFKNTNLRQTRDLLLPKLISGEINVESLDIETKPVTEAVAA